jgi:hypothetical protein
MGTGLWVENVYFVETVSVVGFVCGETILGVGCGKGVEGCGNWGILLGVGGVEKFLRIGRNDMKALKGKVELGRWELGGDGVKMNGI